MISPSDDITYRVVSGPACAAPPAASFPQALADVAVVAEVTAGFRREAPYAAAAENSADAQQARCAASAVLTAGPTLADSVAQKVDDHSWPAALPDGCLPEVDRAADSHPDDWN
jgi:hypothetical protein